MSFGLPSPTRVARKFVAAFFNVGDIILYGKYKNKKGKILSFGQDAKGNPTVTIEPVPKGRKQDKTMTLFKIWRMPEVEKTAAEDVDKAFFEAWSKRMDKEAVGLDLKDAEDRVTFRLRMQAALKSMPRLRLQDLVDNMGAPRSTANRSLILDLANAYISGKRIKVATSRSVVAKFKMAGPIPLGKTFNLGSVRIHRFRDHFKIWDLTNAGKRGKKVRVMTLAVVGYYYKGDPEQWMENMSKALPSYQSYDEVMKFIKDLQSDYPNEIRLNEYEERGIDVDPVGEKITLKTDTDMDIKAEPREFLVNSSYFFTNKDGKPTVKQDTLYYSRDKQGAGVFYTWLKSNLSKVNKMTITELREVWDSLGVKYDYH